MPTAQQRTISRRAPAPDRSGPSSSSEVRPGGAPGLRKKKVSPLGSAHVLMAPAIVFSLALIAFPMLYTVWMSLSDFRFGSDPRFNAGANYLQLSADPVFWHGLMLTLLLFMGALVLQLLTGTYLGLLLNQRIAGQRVIRAILLSPFMLPSVVVGMLWLVILDPSIGAANYILQSMGLPPSSWLANPSLVMPVMVVLDTWQWAPFVALIVLGGLQALPEEPYEAAYLEGASRPQVFWYITLPLLRPTLFTAAILRSVDLLRFFDLIYITTQGGPGDASNTLNIYAYRRGFEFFDLGYASAIMIVLLLIVLAVVWLLGRFRRSLA
jgi:multiple sugar transport system permease protein